MSIAKSLFATIALSAITFCAHASIVTYTDTVTAPNNGDKIKKSDANPYAIDFDILQKGYNPLTQTLTSAVLTINLTDNAGDESYEFDIGSGKFLQIVTGNNVPNHEDKAYPITLTSSLGDLSQDGKLTVNLSASSGDYIFLSSTLQANASPLTSNVPEPASLALMGLGLGAVALRRRKG